MRLRESVKSEESGQSKMRREAMRRKETWGEKTIGGRKREKFIYQNDTILQARRLLCGLGSYLGPRCYRLVVIGSLASLFLVFSWIYVVNRCTHHHVSPKSLNGNLIRDHNWLWYQPRHIIVFSLRVIAILGLEFYEHFNKNLVNDP